jgi:Ca2+:H+ antiporter
VLALLLPAAFFSGITSTNAPETAEGITTVFTDGTKRTLLEISRGIANILLVVYLASRIYLHNPPGENNILALHPLAPQEFKEQEHHLSQAEPDVNQYVCIVMLLVVLCLTGLTAEFLVQSIEFVREKDHIQIEWFGLILLPFVSWAADGVVSLYLFMRAVWKRLSGRQLPYTSLAKARSIDLSVQFALFWMPFLVLLGWWMQHPFTLLFDFFEIAALLGATFLVNYVTADAKTNWAEGFVLVAFYTMIALAAWFYTGQPALNVLLYERWPEKCDALAHTLEAAAGSAAGGH